MGKVHQSLLKEDVDMKSFDKKMLATIFSGGLALVGTQAANAAVLGANLVVDPGFEDVNATTGAYGALQLNSWAGGSHTGYTYASGQYDNGGPLAGGGQRYFTSNQTSGGGTDAVAPGEIAQVIDLSTGDTATQIAAGTAGYDFSAFFTTYSTDGDFGAMHLDFQNAGGASLGTDTIGPAANEGGWVQHAGGGLIPIGTAKVAVSVYGTAVASGPDGYVDNTSFSVNEIPEPASLALLGLGGLLMLRRRKA